ncbi:hypothetical protein AAHE18_05G150500 [Arachis hypogaea]
MSFKHRAYVQQLEISRLKLMQLEEEIVKVKKTVEYENWIEEQHKLNEELRNAFQTKAHDEQLNQLIQTLLNHYSNLFKMKSDAAKVDIFYLISGIRRSSAERLFLWIEGSRPLQLLCN